MCVHVPVCVPMCVYFSKLNCFLMGAIRRCETFWQLTRASKRREGWQVTNLREIIFHNCKIASCQRLTRWRTETSGCLSFAVADRMLSWRHDTNKDAAYATAVCMYVCVCECGMCVANSFLKLYWQGIGSCCFCCCLSPLLMRQIDRRLAEDSIYLFALLSLWILSWMKSKCLWEFNWLISRYLISARAHWQRFKHIKISTRKSYSLQSTS